MFDVNTLAAHIQMSTTDQRLAGTFAGAFGVLALALAAIGLFGMLAYSTRRRMFEIGVRMAIGAQRADILSMILRQGGGTALLGLAIGLAASLAISRALASALFGITPMDPVTYLTVTVLLFCVALAACYVPARRAASLDPISAMRDGMATEAVKGNITASARS